MTPVTRLRIHRAGLLIAIPFIAACSAPQVAEDPGPPLDPLVGTWRAVLDSPGGELPFTLDIWEVEGGLEGAMVNGTESAPFSHVSREDNVVSLVQLWAIIAAVLGACLARVK